MTSVKLKTGIWYGERTVEIELPPSWDLVTHWPQTPEALSEEQIEASLDEPVGCGKLADLARAKRAVSIVVDDLSRPTPAYRVLPFMLSRLHAAGVPEDGISIVVATGTHGTQDDDALRSKLGDEAWQTCRIEVHNDLERVKFIGKTSYGTPVYVNRGVLASDLVLGVGGVYPQHTTGFGGGGKLSLGVCGRQTIMELHYKHKSMEGRYDTNNDFRRDVCEIAQMIRLNASVSVHIDAFSNVINVLFGDPMEYYDVAAEFSKKFYTAPIAVDADLVIANAYPLDTSFTFMRKGYKPLYTAPRSAVKVMIASAHEGIGVHGLFQHINPSRWTRLRNLYLRAMSMNKLELSRKIVKRLAGMLKAAPDAETGGGDADVEDPVTVLPPNTDHLYVWRTDPDGLPIPDIANVTVGTDWRALMQTIQERHFRPDQRVRAHLYPCSPIQCQDED